MALYMEINEIYFQELLQPSSQGQSATKTLSLDLAIKMLQQTQVLFMATPNG
jgi:hypothetical protein